MSKKATASLQVSNQSVENEVVNLACIQAKVGKEHAKEAKLSMNADLKDLGDMIASDGEIKAHQKDLGDMIGNTLVVGYLVHGAMAHDRKFYINDVAAWICIEGRGLAAAAGVGAIAISRTLENAYSAIRDKNWGRRSNDPSHVDRSKVLAGQFLDKYHWLSQACEIVLSWVIVMFMLGFILGVISYLKNDLQSDDTTTNIWGILATLFLVITVYFEFHLRWDRNNFIDGEDRKHARQHHSHTFNPNGSGTTTGTNSFI